MSSPDISNAATSGLEQRRRAVLARLATVRRAIRWQLVLEGLAWAVCAAALLTALSLLLDRTLRPERPVRFVLLGLSAVAIAAVAVRRLYRPAMLRLDDLDLADLLERRQTGIGQRLANVLLLPQLLKEDPHASPAMIEAAVQEDFVVVEKTDLHSTFNRDRRRNAWMLIAGTTALVAVFCLANPATASLWARRWFAGADLRWPQRTYLAVIGLGDSNVLQVPRGESALLQIDATPEFQPLGPHWRLTGRGVPLLIESAEKPQSQPPSSVSLLLKLADGSSRRGVFTHFTAGQYRYELPPLTGPAEVQITGGDDWFGPLRIEPIDRPDVGSLTLRVRTPGSDHAETVQANSAEQQLLFLPGTQLEIELASTQPLTAAHAAVSGTDQVLEMQRQDDQHYQFSWDLKDPITFEFQLAGKSGLEAKPYFLTLGILNDRAPRLTLRSSGVGRRVTPVAKIPLHLRAVDDFGIAELMLELEETRVIDSKPATSTHQPLKESFSNDDDNKLPLDLTREPTLGLTEYSLIPGATVRIRGKATDACVLGVQTSESRWLTFQVVSADELFYEILTRQREQRNRFAKALQSEKEQKLLLGRITTKSEVSQAVRVLQADARQVWQVAGQLSATLLEMSLNEIGTAPARELLETGIIQPLRVLHDDRLSELRSRVERLSAETIDEARREEALMAQTEVIEEMQRIYERMSQWESFVDVVNQLRNVISSQDQLREATEETKKKQINDVFDDE